MAGRSTRAGGRSTPVDTVNPQQLQQPQCEEAHLQTPPQTHQGLSPPRTRRDSTLHNDWNGDDIPMADNIPTADNTFHPTFQMPHSAYSTFNAAFPPRSTGNVDRAALNNIVEQSFQQFWFDFAETLFVS
ncbi:hypothetical protein N7476_005105 [Penicillium atrosanguineum]|uniref:Uncharacterized protein n=1 Tax=Penicillium atrosanguineum TaxID=1132637 RepID=A0A9W9U5U0_9EURO|nr:hypothetical protein N7526_011518 [Penicillium atrosanguineum]KAJ5318685.1 hypothetical protein N7476_005105 [Penicillium atrosanguineum]